MYAISLVVGFALATLEARKTLSSYSNALAHLDQSNFRANSNSLADNFYRVLAVKLPNQLCYLPCPTQSGKCCAPH